MIIERPLYGKVDIQAWNGTSWETYISDATGVSIRRGGSRDGLGVKTDVGLCSFVLKDAQDPLDGGTFTPGQLIRVISGEYVAESHPIKLSEGFETTLGIWGGVNGTLALAGGAGIPHTGSRAARISSSGTLRAGIRATVGGFVVGRSYTLSAWFKPSLGMTAGKVGIVGGTQGATTNPGANVYGIATVDFTATATSHALDLSTQPAAAGDATFWDDITVVEHITEVVTPLFTGRISDISSGYPIDKGNGTKRAMVTVTAADAVGIHTRTPRYGVQIAEGFETFESRVNRLSSSAQAAIEVPPVGAPREVYAF